MAADSISQQSTLRFILLLHRASWVLTSFLRGASYDGCSVLLVYSNSLLATLNARKNIRGQVDDEHLMVSIPASALSSGTPTGTHNRSKNIARSQRISIHVATAKEYLADDGDHKMNDDSGDVRHFYLTVHPST